MPSSENRRLAAILFADIVGYTALMQKDEQEASSILRHFQKQLEEKVETHNGKVVNFYGDGALCTFQIPIDAVRCAMALQSTFQNEPKTPVRIGIHSGTVTYEGDKIFGDSVNITSRIESMGVAGGILLSKKVRDEVKNNPDLQMRSLGNFEFKNVEEPMEVFALANKGFVVPKRSQIQGKLKPQKNKWMIQLVILGMLTIVFGFWKTTINGIDFQGNNSSEPTDTPISEEYRQKRVAVMVFDNKTGRDNLEDFGVMISDWITRGLMETGEAKIISAANITAQIEEAGTNTAELAKTTGVGVILQGRYYLQENQLIIHANIVDAVKGEVIYALAPIQGQQDKMLSLLNELTQEILGYWAIKGQKRFLANPPKYEAYQAYLKGEDLWFKNPQQSEQYFRKAFKLDTNFYAPLLSIATIYNNNYQYVKYDTILNLIKQLNPDFSEFEQLRYESFRHVRSDWDKNGVANQRLFELDPSNWLPFYSVSQSLIKSNKPQQALDYIEAMKGKYPLSHSMFSQAILRNSIKANFFLANYDAVTEIAGESLNKDQEIYTFNAACHIKSLIRLNQIGDLDEVLARYEKKDLFAYTGFHQSNKELLLKIVCDELYLLGKKDLLQKYINQLRKWTEENANGNERNLNMGFINWYLEDFQKALNWWKKEQYPKNNLLLNLFKHYRHGLCYAKLNQREAAFAEIEKIQNLPEPGIVMDDTKPFAVGIIQANLGQKQAAMESLKLAIKRGLAWEPSVVQNTVLFPFKNNIFLKPMFGYPPFEELVKPKG